MGNKQVRESRIEIIVDNDSHFFDQDQQKYKLNIPTLCAESEITGRIVLNLIAPTVARALTLTISDSNKMTIWLNQQDYNSSRVLGQAVFTITNFQ